MRSTTVERFFSPHLRLRGRKDAGVDITKPVTGAEASNAARRREGMQEKKDQNPMEATRFFEYVRNNSLLQYAALAQLAIADIAFERDDGASREPYRNRQGASFAPQGDYAAFRSARVLNDRPRSSSFCLEP